MKLFAKPRIAHALHGKTCAAVVAPGRANDSPHLGEMLAMMPRGSDDVLGDVQCGGLGNCQAIKGSVCRHITETKSSDATSGFNAKVEMLKFREERPDTFHGYCAKGTTRRASSYP